MKWISTVEKASIRISHIRVLGIIEDIDHDFALIADMGDSTTVFPLCYDEEIAVLETVMGVLVSLMDKAESGEKMPSTISAVDVHAHVKKVRASEDRAEEPS